MSNQKSENLFINKLISAFPELKDEVLDDDYAGLISLQISVFKRFTQKAINDSNLSLVKKCFDFVDANIDVAEQKINNSLFISYLGKLELKGRVDIEKLLPVKLKQHINLLNVAYATPLNYEKANKFLNDLSRKNK